MQQINLKEIGISIMEHLIRKEGSCGKYWERWKVVIGCTKKEIFKGSKIFNSHILFYYKFTQLYIYVCIKYENYSFLFSPLL